MKRVALLTTLAALAAAAPAHAGGPDSYSYGIDGFKTCSANASAGGWIDPGATYVCADRLVFELTDGGQLRRLPYCYADAVEGIFTSLTAPIRRQFGCNETWLGTNLEPKNTPLG